MNADFSRDLMQCLGWTLVHFLWQGVVVAALLAVCLRSLRLAPPNRRYLAGCTALLLLACAPVITMICLTRSNHAPAIATVAPVVAPASNPITTTVDSTTTFATAVKLATGKFDLAQQFERFLPGMVAGWGVGVAALTFRLGLGWLQINQLKRRTTFALDETWLARLAELKRRLGISRPVRLLQSALVEVPAVIGWLRPVILLPAGCVAGLSPAQLEAILAHELAHIRRHDYLVNLLQSILETLLFYHPAVWWISRKVREEREHCCDDLAVEICGDRIGYARALATLEELRPAPSLALAANGAVLLPRIRRLAGKNDGAVNRAAWPVAAIIILILLAAILFEWRHHRVVSVAPFRPLTSHFFRVDPTKFPEPLSGLLRDVISFSQNNYPTARPEKVRRPGIFGQWSMISDKGVYTSSYLNPSEAGKAVHAEMLRFFSGMGVDFEADHSTNAGMEFMYDHVPSLSLPQSQPGSLMVRASAADVEKIQKGLEQLDAIAKPGASTPQPPNRVARLAGPPGNASVPREVTDAIRKAQQAAAAQLGRPFPPVPPPLNTAAGIDPQTGLPVSGNTPPRPPIDFRTGLPYPTVAPTNPSAPAVIDPHTGAPTILKGPTNQPSLPPRETRTFHVDPQLFILQLEAMYGLQIGAAEEKDGEGGLLTSSQPGLLIRELFKESGADFSTNNPANADKMFVYGDRKGLLMVHATPDDLNAIQLALDKMNVAAPAVVKASNGKTYVTATPIANALNVNPVSDPKSQINLKVRFVEIEDTPNRTAGFEGDWNGRLHDMISDDAPLLPLISPDVGATKTIHALPADSVSNTAKTTVTGVLRRSEAAAIFRELEHRDGTEELAAPEATMPSGRRAQIQAVNMETIVMGVESAKDANGKATNIYKTMPIPTGPVLDITPEVLADRNRIKIRTIASITEFVGYADMPVGIDPEARNQMPMPPMPHFRVGHVATERTVDDGETIVLTGLITQQTNTIKDKVFLLGDIPVISHLFTTTTSSVIHKRLIVFVTPTLIHSDGTLVHPDPNPARVK